MTDSTMLLQAITDRAMFEKIAAAILRVKYPKLGNLMESGLNSKGESVKSPLDGFSKSGANEFSFIEYTTDDSDLKGKWLHDTSTYSGKKSKDPKPEGDLLKALGIVKTARAAMPKSIFIVFLVTNQKVGNKLAIECETLALKADVKLEIVELSMLADFLDNQPHGHWLRYKYFGIEAQLISRSLLFDFAELNRILYAARFSVDKKNIFLRSEYQKTAQEIASSSFSLHFLVGNSGMGKTYFSYWLHLHESHDNKLVIILDPKTVLDFSNPEDALYAELQKNLPGLHYDPVSFHNVIRSFKNIMFIIDDVNQHSSPNIVLDQLAFWARQEDVAGHGIKLICPIWPANFLSGPRITEKLYFSYSVIKEFSDNDCPNYLKKHLHSITNLQAKNIAVKLGNDPLLTTLYISTNIDEAELLPDHNLIGQYLFEEIRQVARAKELIINDAVQVINDLGLQLLLQKNLNPSYTDLKSWLPADTIEILKDVFQNKKLVFLDDFGIIRFRHDRLRDQILINALDAHIGSVAIKEVDINQIIADPYFSKVISGALNGRQLTEDDIDYLLSVNPAVVFHIYPDTKDNIHNVVLLKKITDWNNKNKILQSSDSVAHHILNVLMEANVSLVDINTITAGFKGHDQYLNLLRFKFGDFISGLRYLGSYPDFQPMYGNLQRDDVISHVISYYYDDIFLMIEKCLLEDELQINALPIVYQMAGYWKSPKLASSIYSCWEKSQSNEERHFTSALWAIIQTVDAQSEGILRKMLEFWESLPDEGTNEYNLPKGIKNHIVFTFAHTSFQMLYNEQIEILKGFADVGLALPLINAIFGRLDAVIAHGHILEHKVAIQKSLKPGYFSPYLLSSRTHWRQNGNGKQMSEEGVAFFKEKWQNRENDEVIRSFAFSDWCDNASDGDVIRELSKINRTDKTLYRKSLYRRLEAGDRSVTKTAIRVIGKEDHFLWNLHKAWDANLKQYVIKNFMSLISDSEKEIMTGTLLAKIPSEDTQEILETFPESVIDSPFIFQSALSADTEITRKMARVAMEKANDKAGMFLYMSTAGCLATNNGKLSQRILNTLNPYISVIKENDLQMLAYDCQQQGLIDWAKRYLAPYLSAENKKRFFPSEEQLLEELSNPLERRAFNWEHHWIENLPSRAVDEMQLFAVFQLFVEQERSERNFVVLCNCLQASGKRKWLFLLDKYAENWEHNTFALQDLIRDVKYSVMKLSLE